MKYSLILFAFLVSGRFTQAQEMPEIDGETVDNASVKIPSDLRGKYSLLCFASSMKAQSDLESWLDPVYQKFIAKTGLMDDLYDVNVFFIPVLTGTNITFAATMRKKFRENAQEDLKPHVLFCNNQGSKILSALNIEKSEAPHLYLLDKEGRVLYKTSGKYTEEKFDQIDDLIE
jgi:hypothetical protein